MCRLPKVLLVAPEDRHSELRRALSSLEYDVAAAVASLHDADDVSADVAVLWSPEAGDVAAARARGLKAVAVGGAGDADMHLDPEELATFKTRIWELFRPG